MKTETVNTPTEIACMLSVHNFLTSEDYFLAEAKFKGLNEVDQVAVLWDIVRNRVASNPKTLEKLKNMMDPLAESQEDFQS